MSVRPDAEIRIVRGAPSAEEVAVLTALIAARSRAADEATNAPLRGRWNDPAYRVRRYWRPGPGGWLAAGGRLHPS